MSFNDYAESRGMENAQDWTFYSVNDVTPDGNKFIGAGVNPDGQDVSFLIDFSDPVQTYSLNLVAVPVEGGEVFGAGEYEAGMPIEIEAIANENYAFINWTNSDGDVVATEAVTTVILEDGDLTLTANFTSTVGMDNFLENSFRFYPNPVMNKLSVEVYEPVQLQVLDLSGRILSEIATDAKVDIDVSDLNPGIYLIQVNSSNRSFCQKFVKK